ncbi:hypothetical protein BBO99_00004213 [Phytophthora kernoviae]|uniref:Palmitoyltransferase n=2 Tax=Phytophthora kernoviae TaxID=325452 RepID=A0A3R7GXX2_9STRA|nr:hypothetical protein G195_006708 [Phytophthora kernoviae 00238/432]KAG2525204.1 hypothetical protein JM18_005002 [Phytophthora kernoviae]KAG2525920.1 hypothetical protein JM16_004172 [Phytophthora kernoviae]RLN02033.1 hypothetical protein BBI17_004375 [Phytophthora kernoviae]RLN80814.1 hypothetical protein BBO99_00004213 [Phytophthora kernoviae]
MDVDYDGQTAFDAAANGDFPLVVLLWGMAMAVQPKPVDLLSARDKHGNTLAHYAAAGGTDTLDTMHFLMQQMQASGREKMLMDARNDAEETPFIRAAHVGSLRLADTLLRTGFVDLMAQDKQGNTAAHHAAAQGHLWMLHFLLEAEQRQKIAASSAQQPVQPTTLGGYCHKRRNVLHYACMSGYKPMVQYLMTRGFEGKEADADGTTCLDVVKQRSLGSLQDLLTDKVKASDPPTHMRKTRGIVAVLHGVEVVFLSVWFRLAFFCPTDPGTIASYEADVKMMLEQAARAETPDATKFCRTCLVMKPIRSKHCSQCGVCIARLDHHCAWINRCVGYGNHRSFFVFLLLHFTVLVVYAVLAVLVLADATHDLHAERVKSEGSSSTSNDDNLSAMDVWIEIPSLVSKHLLVIMVLLWAVMAFGAITMMVNQHVNNIEQNLTINEQMNWRRYAYLTQPSSKDKSDGGKQSDTASAESTLSNPFDRGFRKNIAEFFFHSGNAAVDYRQVFALPLRDSEIVSPVGSTAMSPSTENADLSDVV